MKRWPVIRHIRYLYLEWKFLTWWDKVGRHYWLVPNQADWDYLDKVWEGKA